MLANWYVRDPLSFRPAFSLWVSDFISPVQQHLQTNWEASIAKNPCKGSSIQLLRNRTSTFCDEASFAELYLLPKLQQVRRTLVAFPDSILTSDFI